MCSKAEEKLATVEAEAVAASNALAAAQKAAQEALDELNAQQKAYDDKCSELKTIKESDKGIVTKNRAAAELAQLLAKRSFAARSGQDQPRCNREKSWKGCQKSKSESR